MFQFQNGSIKSFLVFTILITLEGFQFQNGSIKSMKGILAVTGLASFNSKMVRLKGGNMTGNIRRKEFQFQNGSIKSP